MTLRLLEPKGIEEPGDRHTARLLAGLTLCFAALGSCSITLELLLVPGFLLQAIPQVIGTAMLLVAYACARGPRWRMGGAIVAATPALAASAVLVVDPGDPIAPAFMLLGVVFATFFLRFAHAAAMAAGIFMLLLVVLLLRTELREPTTAVPLVVLHLIASPCLLWAAAHRERVDRIRRTALRDDERMHAERERLEAVGRLASGIAHDFNNLLSVVRVNSEVLLESAAMRDRQLLDEMRLVAERGAALIQTLLSFARKAPIEVRTLDLHEAVVRVGVLVSRLLGEHVTLKVQHATTVPLVHAAPSHVEQIILNLVLNARDAMVQGGTVTVATDVVDGRARLSVADTGTGMAPEVVQRIFDPFFTTKKNGSGLGLATVHDLIVQIGATIDVQTAPGAGTTMVVAFPAPPPPEAAAAAASEHVVARSILVVDDDELVRRLIQRVLEGDGHTVRTAASGADALRALEAHRDTSVLVTDVSMPGMTGPQLVERARALAPRIRVLYVSAMPDREHPTHDGDALLAKPFAPQALRAAVAGL
ncbi:MAG: response regulator [Deltaproteobacteria bacterium]|nr:response regulator [Deltaproteobacteria bacterium]